MTADKCTHPFESKPLTQARLLAISALRRLGVDIGERASIATVERHLERRGVLRAPKEGTTDYFVRFAEANTKRPAREAWPFKPLKPKSHPRQAEIDALPSQITMHGVGNGREDHTQFIRGAGRGS